ncbi:putative flavin-containing monooxygenase [Gordonia effusa NBRC 100432]|uniref:Putative flavin-containing monooxygenase n=1 Tax=Gordonia effusa NBRC 100432 TaxID=1077974 RepID=H0R3W9_9ACTN|nr:NAD(P)/FAD-dependent oxidoreductase [Gordonia effusa]GAB19770.1 putative flavin-containing monooxygenase [Gordonia effusa NBRC 100432]
MREEPDHEVIIIGAGFGGIGAGVELSKAGIDDFVIIEKNAGIGGTWWANTYPGVAVDIPSIYYSFSYEPPKTWSRVFAPGAEVQKYAEQVVDAFGLRSRIRLNTRIIDASWDDDQHLWRARLDGGETITSRFAIGAVGALEQPQMPDIAGVETFAGKVVHTATWDHDYEYAGKRIGVIGTGATALQLIPELADVASHLAVFQRTPIWVAPKPDMKIPRAVARTLLRVSALRRGVRAVVTLGIDFGITGIGLFHDRVPGMVSLLSKGGAVGYRAWLRGNPELAQKLTPNYAPGCKRPSVSNRYLKTFTRKHVDLVTAPIEQITATGVISSDGAHDLDVLVCATGFKVMDKGATPPFPLRGVGDKDLNEFWDQNRFQAYQGVSIPGFPNAFMITGPYGFAAGSYLAMIECTSRHAARAIAEARRRGATRVEIGQEAHDAYYQKCRARAEKSMWLSSACEGSNTYYVNYQGDAAAIRPSTHFEMWWGNKHFPYSDYRYTAVREVSVPTEESAGVRVNGAPQ